MSATTPRAGGAELERSHRSGRRIAHLSAHHAPLDSRIFGKECRSLAAAGYDVHLIARDPHADEYAGVKFHRAAPPPSPARRLGLIRRIIGHVGSIRRVYEVARGIGADLYHVHEPLLIPAGIALKVRGATVIYDAHEDSPRNALALNRGPRGWLLALIWTVLERAASVSFDSIVAATPSIAGRYPAERTALVRNFPDLDELGSGGEVPYGDREPSVVYVGGLFRERGAIEMIGAVARVSFDGIRLDLAGRFRPSELQDEARAERGWERVRFHGWASREQVRDLLGSARVGLVLLHSNRAYREALPVKLFEYMAAGLPVIASDFPLWRAIVEEAGCGLLVDPLDQAAIAGAISYLLNHPAEAEEMGRRGRLAVERRYSWNAEKLSLLKLYRSLGA